MPKYRLITIPVSHYCEKARWGLDRLQLPYVEDGHLQGFHYPKAFWHGRGPFVPILIAGKKVITESSRILQFLDEQANTDQKLYPQAQKNEIIALEKRFDDVLGVESRRWAYHHYLKHPHDLF